MVVQDADLHELINDQYILLSFVTLRSTRVQQVAGDRKAYRQNATFAGG